MNTQNSSLLDLITFAFSEDELRSLCFELNIEFEELPAIFGKTGKARELILMCQRHGRLTELITACQAMRPTLSWPDPAQFGLDLFGDTLPFQPDIEPETIFIPKGPFLMGSPNEGEAHSEELPQHEVHLADYRIGMTPVTNAQYAVFLKQTKYRLPRGWLTPQPPTGKEQHPIVNVSWLDAAAYCEWLKEKTKRPYRLPTEAEWEKAARGDDGRLYPWGNEWQDNLCNHNAKSTTPVSAFPEGASPYGCLDMIGNVREWTNTLWGPDYQTSDFPYPYKGDDGREEIEADTAVYRLVRSSSFRDTQIQHRCAYRTWFEANKVSKNRGFRIVMAEQQTFIGSA